jgi:cytidine deaminase
MSEFRTIEVKYTVHADAAVLSEAERELIAEARAAASRAYAPYSRFEVGAALRLDNGTIVSGNNQENASFPAGICAERTALHAAMAGAPQARVVEMAIVVPSVTGDRPVSPCGICRQALLEQEVRQGSPMRLLLATASGVTYELASAGMLLPLSFDRSFLNV